MAGCDVSVVAKIKYLSSDLSHTTQALISTSICAFISSLFDTFPDEIKAQINDYIETGNKKETLGIKSVGKAKITLKNSHCSYHLKTKKIK